MKITLPPLTRHAATVSGPNRARVAAAAWSYAHPRSREVYIDIEQDGRHVGTVRVMVRGGRSRT